MMLWSRGSGMQAKEEEFDCKSAMPAACRHVCDGYVLSSTSPSIGQNIAVFAEIEMKGEQHSQSQLAALAGLGSNLLL